MINKFVKAAALIAALTGGAAHASTFDFSYTFADGLALTGTLDGTLSGTNVTNVSNISVVYNGTAFTGSLVAGSFDSSINDFNFNPSTAVISTNASLNNFILADSTDENSITNYFYFVNGTTPDGIGTQEIYAASTNSLANNADYDNPGTGTWSLTAATPVPVPAALPLMLSGLGLLGLSRRRRLGRVVQA